MRPMGDPFPATPGRFHLRVERTLGMLEEKDMNKNTLRRTWVLLVAALVAALLAATAVAAINGHSGLKARLNEEDASEAASLVQEPHIAAGGEDGFEFSIDEILWEDADLYVSYSLSVPEDGNYLVALYTPTLNGEALAYDAKGFTSPKFLDEETPAALLLGGKRGRSCEELWTFRADPALKGRRDNRLRFHAALLRTDAELRGGSDWTDLLAPPEAVAFAKDWRDWALMDVTDAQAEIMDAAAAALEDGRLTLPELAEAARAEVVAERDIDLALDATQLEDTLYDDVAEHDFDVDGVHLHVDEFRLTHLGASLRCTLSVPGAKPDDRAAVEKLNAFLDLHWAFGTPEGKPLGFSLGGTGGSGWAPLADGTPAYGLSWSESCFASLDGLGQVLFAPVTWRDDARGRQLPPEYDLDRAVALTPIRSKPGPGATAPAPDVPEEGWDISR